MAEVISQARKPLPIARKEPKLYQMTADLNIVLKPEDINTILQQILGPRGDRIPEIMIAADYCCVDAAVGSSVLGPASTVASSVSIPGPEDRFNIVDLEAPLEQIASLNTKFTIPEKVILR